MNVKAINKLKHCIGLETYKIDNGRYKYYRNYFGVRGRDADLDEMVKEGYASVFEGAETVYHVTDAGFRFLEEILGIRITKQ